MPQYYRKQRFLWLDRVVFSVPALALIIGAASGAFLYSCHDQSSFREKKARAERELASKLELGGVIPEGWKIVSQPVCVTWCRTMYGSEFDVEVLTNEPSFTKVRISCDTEADERSCAYRRLVPPCEER